MAQVICLSILSKYYREHRFVGVFEYREPKLMILDPALVVDIYVKYFKHFADNSMSETVCEIINKVLYVDASTVNIEFLRYMLKQILCSNRIHLSRPVLNGKSVELNCRQLLQCLG